MKILLVHNYYQQSGGEDVVFHEEKKLLESRGHLIDVYLDNNMRIKNLNKFKLFVNTIWSFSTYKKIYLLLKKFEPNIVHVHNFFPLISPSLYYACNTLNIPVIQTIHNFRLLCPNALLYRNGEICEKCIKKKFAYPGIFYKCYHGSYLQTATISLMTFYHHLLKTWENKVNLYIAVSLFLKNKLIESGFSEENIIVKPNFISNDPGISNIERKWVLFIGRLSREKGVNTLIKAWSYLSDIPLKIVGQGELKNKLKDKNINYLGSQDKNKVFTLLKQSKFLILPSEWYETFGLVIIEAFATGTPVIASRLGAMAEIVEDGKTGLLFNPGDPQDLAAKVKWAWEHPEEMAQMGQNARREYEQKYTAERNYEMLMAIYQKAIEMKRKGRGGGMGYRV